MAFLDLWSDAALVLTDSGGLQEETTALGVPCLTLRDTTERPVTISNGSNQLAGTEPSQILTLARTILARDSSHIFDKPALWDGQAARRIVDRLRLFLQCE
jgi:UDP-N-acetylglucosamine 2-epimerase (non-hydrolysing)